LFSLKAHLLCALENVSTRGLTTKQNIVLKGKVFHLENAKAKHFDL